MDQQVLTMLSDQVGTIMLWAPRLQAASLRG
jgi:hypothetical protein